MVPQAFLRSGLHRRLVMLGLIWTSSALGAKEKKIHTTLREDADRDQAIRGPWHFLGPFAVGKTEVDSDPVEAYGGIRNISRSSKRVFFSEVVEGGKVKWSTPPTSAGGIIDLSFPSEKIPMQPNRLVQSLSKMSALEYWPGSRFQGWLVSDFIVQDEGRYLLKCSPAHHVEVDSTELFHGDIYRQAWAWNPITLTAGVHELRVRVRAKGQAQLACVARRSKSDLELFGPITSAHPDIVGGHLAGGLVNVAVLNTREEWQQVKLVLEKSSLPPGASKTWGKNAAVPKVALLEGGRGDRPVWVAPGAVVLVDAHLSLEAEGGGGVVDAAWADAAPADGACMDATLRVARLDDGEFVQAPGEVKVQLRCRKANQSFIFTFRDHDGSVSHAAAVRPWEPCDPAGGCPVLLSLSGVGVKANDQADAHKYRPIGSDFVFGYPNVDPAPAGAWVLAPERDGAHNWEGTGFQCAMRSIPALSEMARYTKTFADFAVDTNRVLYAGHSRGGHGAWMMAMHHADASLGVAALSGWWKREMYADANILFDLDLQLAHMDPGLKAVFEHTIVDHDSSQMASNLKGLEVVVRTGSDDSSVPPWQSRRMGRVLQEHGVNVTFTEFAGKGHWWWDTKVDSDGGAMNDPALRTFYLTRLAGGHPLFPQELRIVVYNPSTHSGRAGFSVQQQLVPYRKSELRVHGDGGALTVTTVNVRRLALTRWFRRWGNEVKNGIYVDGQHFGPDLIEQLIGGWREAGGERASAPSATLLRPSRISTWQVVLDGGEWAAKQRSPATYGPARQVFASRFLIVVGSKTENITELQHLLSVGVYLSGGHARASATRAEVVDESRLTPEMVEHHNLILVGGSTLNSASSKFLEDWPGSAEERFEQGAGVRIAGCDMPEARSIIYTHPRRTKGQSSVPRIDLHIAGASVEAIEAAVRFSFAVNQALTRAPLSNMVPDFMVHGPEFKWKGYGGLLAAGFWGNEWDFQDHTGFLPC